ncbi:hypothetical protein AAHB56_28340 [Bacillus thuringiensis]
MEIINAGSVLSNKCIFPRFNSTRYIIY